MPLDLTSEASIAGLLASVGAVDVLINNAGASQIGPVEEAPPDRVRELFALNLFGQIQLIQGLLPGMRERRRGHIVNVASFAGVAPVPFSALYAGSKAALIAVTRGLRDKLSRDELQAVIAHEMSHVRHYDIRYAMLIAVMVGVLVMLCDIFLRSVWYGGAYGRRSRRSSDRGGGGGAQIILIVLALVLAIIAPILAKIIEMALSRQREYLADAGGVELARNPQALATALAKVSGDEEVLEVANRATAPLYFVHPIKSFEERSSSIFDSHPPVRERIKRILSLGA